MERSEVCPSGRAGGFSILEVLAAIAIAMIVLGLSAGFSFAVLSKERLMNRISARIEVPVRQASMISAIDRKTVYLVLKEQSLEGFGRRYDLEGGKLSIMQKGGRNRWITPPNSGYSWKFDSTGMAEPMQVRLAFPWGVCTMDFDPLTGEVKERATTIYE